MIEIFSISVSFAIVSIVIDVLKQPEESLQFLLSWEQKILQGQPLKTVIGWRKFVLKGWIICVKCRAGQLTLLGVPVVCWLEQLNYSIIFHLLGIAIAIFVGWYYTER